MGVPVFEPHRVPFQADSEAAHYELDVAGNTVTCGIVSMGNPHCVVTIDAIEHAPVAGLGPELMHHPDFPQSANVSFMQVLTSEHIRLRVLERPGHETLACGSGACASVVVGNIQGALAESVEVDLPGGRLHIRWPGRGRPVLMTGPTAHVYDGRIEIDEGATSVSS
jgi:diaminopimelate epimerase